MIATGNLEPQSLRTELWTTLEGTEWEHSFFTQVCEINGQTVTEFTLTNQRGYNYNKEANIWSLPKSNESINSL
jgi:hypothetical protein